MEESSRNMYIIVLSFLQAICCVSLLQWWTLNVLTDEALLAEVAL